MSTDDLVILSACAAFLVPMLLVMGGFVMMALCARGEK
jgi:hypothetical protein